MSCFSHLHYLSLISFFKLVLSYSILMVIAFKFSWLALDANSLGLLDIGKQAIQALWRLECFLTNFLWNHKIDSLRQIKVAKGLISLWVLRDCWIQDSNTTRWWCLFIFYFLDQPSVYYVLGNLFKVKFMGGIPRFHVLLNKHIAIQSTCETDMQYGLNLFPKITLFNSHKVVMRRQSTILIPK